MAYYDFKYLPRRTVFDKILRDKASTIACDPNYYGYHCGLASMVYRYFVENLGIPLIAQWLKLFLKIENLLMNYTSHR